MATDTHQTHLLEGAAINELWYVPPTPPCPESWSVYSTEFVLSTLQGCGTDRENIRRTPLWLAAAWICRVIMGALQASIMGLVWVPVVSWFVETFARVFTRNPVGFFLRACYWKAKLKSLGQDTIIDQFVEIWGASNVSIGSHCHINTNVRMAAGEASHGQHGSITVGNFVHIGPGVHIAGRGSVTIGDFVGIMAHAHIYSATGMIERPSDPGQLVSMSHMAPPDQQHIIEAPIVIEPYALVGMMARIMPGVRVGKGAIVHSGAELTKDVPPFANFGGLPRGKIIGWRRPRRRSPKLPRAEANAAGESGATHD